MLEIFLRLHSFENKYYPHSMQQHHLEESPLTSASWLGRLFSSCDKLALNTRLISE